MFYYGVVDVRHNIVSVGNKGVSTCNILMNVGNDIMGARRVVPDVRNC